MDSLVSSACVCFVVRMLNECSFEFDGGVDCGSVCGL